MKKLVCLAASLMLLTGCAKSGGSSSSAGTSENTTSSQAADNEQTTEAVPSGSGTQETSSDTTEQSGDTSQAASSAAEHDFSKITFKVTSAEKLTVLYNGQEFQQINADCSAIFSQQDAAPESLLSCLDYNFDGLPDLFIPAEIGAANTKGQYFYYDPGADEYVSWKALNELDGTIEPDYKKRALICTKKSSASEYEEMTYEWNSGSLKSVQKVVQHLNKETFVLIRDTYEYTEGKETLVKKQQVLVAIPSGEITDIVDLPLNYEG